jgi:hypothetical protein
VTPNPYVTTLIVILGCTFLVGDRADDAPPVTDDAEMEAWNDRAERLARVRAVCPALAERMGR